MWKRSFSVDVGGIILLGVGDELEVEWVNIKLWKCSVIELSCGVFNDGGVGENNSEFYKVMLWKLWSCLIGDVFDEKLKDEVILEFKKILIK